MLCRGDVELSQLGEEPLLDLNKEEPLSIHFGKTFHQHACARFYRRESRLSPLLVDGDLQLELDSSTVHISLLSEIQQEDHLRVLLFNNSGAFLLASQTYAWSGTSFDCIGRVTCYPGDQSLGLHSSDNGGVSFDLLDEVSSGVVLWLRPGKMSEPGLIVMDPIEVEGVLSYIPQKHEWKNDLSGELINGRQSLPPIFRWNSFAYLPSKVAEGARWRVR